MDVKALRESRAIPPKELLNLMSLAMLYGVIHFSHILIFAYRHAYWRISIQGLVILVYSITVSGWLAKAKRWARWIALGYSTLYGLWNLWAILGWSVMFLHRRPVDLQVFRFNIVASLILGTLVVNLLRPETRQAFRQQSELKATKAEIAP